MVKSSYSATVTTSSFRLTTTVGAPFTATLMETGTIFAVSSYKEVECKVASVQIVAPMGVPRRRWGGGWLLAWPAPCLALAASGRPVPAVFSLEAGGQAAGRRGLGLILAGKEVVLRILISRMGSVL